jgi:hypothetical protein
VFFFNFLTSNEHAERRVPTGGAKIKDFSCFAVFLPSSKRLPAVFIFMKGKYVG